MYNFPVIINTNARSLSKKVDNSEAVCKANYADVVNHSIQMRFQKHLKDVEHCSNWAMAPPSIKAQGPTNVGLHFSQTGHSTNDMQVNLLEFIRLDPNSVTTKPWRETREKFWMHKLKSLKPFGINATDGSNQIRSRPNRPRQTMASQTQSVPSICDT